MSLIRSALCASAAGFCTVAGAQAADLPAKKAAPVEYVRVCKAYGAGFFTIPGTDTCLRVAGRARFEYTYIQQRNRNSSNSGYRGLGRPSLDARTETPYGTLRAFVRFEIASRTGGYLKSGTQERYANAFAATGPDTVATAQKYVEVDKAFVQFLGFTAGRAASFFDFYAHDLEIIGSSLSSDVASTNLFAYTATFGEGFSATISAEDPTFRRNPFFYNIATGTTGQAAGNAPSAQSGLVFLNGAVPFAFVGNAFDPITGVPTSAVAIDVAQRNNVPDFVGVLRYDQKWGSAQISAALHELRLGGYNPSLGSFAVNGGPATPVTNANAPRVPSSEYGYAVQGGVKINLPQIAQGDVLWLQAGYARGAGSYTGVYINQGQELLTGNNTGQSNFPGYDAFVDSRGRVHLTESYSGTIAFLHYWMPELRSGLFATYGRTHNDREIRTQGLSPVVGTFNGASAFSLGTAGGIFSPIGKDYSHLYVGGNLIWSPVRDLDIGVEAIYDRLEFLGGASGGRVVDLNKPLVVGGIPKTVKYDDAIQVRMRVQRDF